MKLYTDLEQSKHLAEILPIESADLMWEYEPHKDTYRDKPTMIPNDSYIFINDIPCWSLAALLDIISYPTLSQGYDGKWSCGEFPRNEEVEGYENPVDACVEIILKHYEQDI